MKAALLSKIALCVCPPAIVATTVATVPPVRQAVHHATRPHHPIRHHSKLHPAVARQVAAIAPCDPTAPATPLLTFADLGPEDLSAVPADTGTTGPLGGGFAGGGPGLGPTAPVAIGGIVPVSPVPEPSTWLMLITGLGLVGTGIRRSRRRYSVVRDQTGMLLVPARQRRGGKLALLASAAVGSAGTIWSELSPVQAGSKTSVIGSKAIGSAVLTKAALTKIAMCVCPPMAMVAGAIALPPVRQAVYAATAPLPVATAIPFTTAAGMPCLPTEATAQVIVPITASASALGTTTAAPITAEAPRAAVTKESPSASINAAPRVSFAPPAPIKNI